MLEPNRVKKEMKALQTHFMEKRDYVVDRLRAMGFNIEEKLVPQATFYLWLDLRCLPDAINDGLNFFEACLKEKCIVVPGIFFDLNPSKRRDLFDSPCHRKSRSCLCALEKTNIATRLRAIVIWPSHGDSQEGSRCH